MRSLFFVTDLNVFIGDEETQGREELNSKPTMFALIWTYPLINFIVASYTISSHWCYDLMLLLHPRMGFAILRRQMNVFVVCIVIFVVIMYLVYMLTLPLSAEYEQLQDLFFYLAIFEWLVAAILIISIFLYLKRIMNINRLYGKTVWIEGIVFTTSNVVAGFFNYYLSKTEISSLIELRNTGTTFAPLFAAIIIPYFIVTEFIPAIVFSFTVNKFARVLSGDANEQNEQVNAAVQNQQEFEREVQRLRRDNRPDEIPADGANNND